MLRVLLVACSLPRSAMARRDIAYPVESQTALWQRFPLYYGDPQSLLLDADLFEIIYIQYHSCLWTSELNSFNDEDNEKQDGDENDYWYRGAIPLASPAAAFSVYGVRSSKLQSLHKHGCRRDTFINSFVTYPGNLLGEEYQYDQCSEDGEGVGCTADGDFAYYEFSLDWNNEPVCDPKHSLSVIDTMDNFNDAMRSGSSCNEVASTSELYSALSQAKACSFEDTACPDPFGRLAQYHKRALGSKTAHSRIPASALWWAAAVLGLGSIVILVHDFFSARRASIILTRSRNEALKRDKAAMKWFRKNKRSKGLGTSQTSIESSCDQKEKANAIEVVATPSFASSTRSKRSKSADERTKGRRKKPLWLRSPALKNPLRRPQRTVSPVELASIGQGQDDADRAISALVLSETPRSSRTPNGQQSSTSPAGSTRELMNPNDHLAKNVTGRSPQIKVKTYDSDSNLLTVEKIGSKSDETNASQVNNLPVDTQSHHGEDPPGFLTRIPTFNGRIGSRAPREKERQTEDHWPEDEIDC